MHPRHWFLPLVALVAAIGYGWGVSSDSRTVSIILKMSPALAMALEVARRRGGAAWALIMALVLHAAGDGLLNLGARYLLAGMAMFFVGHLAYIAAFLPFRFATKALSARPRLVIAVLLIVMTALTVYIWPRLTGVMAVAAPIYAAALTAMAVAALLGHWRGPWVPIGALLFVLSDVLLGLRMFDDQNDLAFLVWPTYVAAQILMPLGYLRTAESTDRHEHGA